MVHTDLCAVDRPVSVELLKFIFPLKQKNYSEMNRVIQETVGAIGFSGAIHELFHGQLVNMLHPGSAA